MVDRETKVNETEVPDSMCAAAGMKAVWGLGNQLFLFAGESQPEPDGHGVGIISAPKIHEAKWDTDMHGVFTRKLVNESQDIFLKLQELGNDSSNTKKLVQLVKISREYRSVIKACVMELQAYIDRCEGDEEQVQLVAHLELFELTELVWNLCEVLFIDTTPGGAVLNQLLDWLRMHFVEGDRIIREALEEDALECHPEYWNALYIYTLQGRVDEVRELLSRHSEASTEDFSVLQQLLARMPTYNTFTGQSVAEFEMKWRHWQDECAQRLEQGQFSTHSELQLICSILCGQDDAFIEQKELLGTWYCMLISRLYYQQPCIKAFDLQYHTQYCIDAFGGHSQMQPYDHMILASLEFDIHQVIREASESFSNWWFAAHLTDLLHHCGKLDNQTLSYGSSLREFLLLEYASSLMSHCSLWQVGVHYLDHCPEYGRYYLEQYIEHIPVDTEKKAQKLLKICETRDLVDQMRSICKIVGMKALHRGRLGSALAWGLRSKDVGFATFLAERFLDEYSASGNFHNLDLIDNLGSSMLLSSKLTFLGKYREFHKLYEEREFKAAAALLLSLLSARVAPKTFWLTLLLDALPLLEAKEVIFDSHQTYELMHCLEEMCIVRRLDVKADSEEPVNTEKEEIEREKLDLMKLALARNLARAIVAEGTLKPLG